jgi:hypothetical protein
MKVSCLFVTIAVVLAAVGTAFGYTMPGYTPYDGLITFDHTGMPITAGAGHLNGAVGYWTANKAFADDSKAYDVAGDNTLIAVPIDLGYAFDEQWMADVTVQLLRPQTGNYDTFGLGDVWVKVRGLFDTGNDTLLGPRLAVKVPVGTVDYTDTAPELGDDQMDVDLAAVFSKYGGDTHFKASAQLGFRYRMKYTTSTYDTVSGNTYDIDTTPGMLIYIDAEPGFGIGPDQFFQIYVPIGYVTSMEDSLDYPANWPQGTPMPSGLSHNTFYAGLHPKYTLDENNTLGLKFLYPVMGKNVPQGMLVALTVDSFIPF